jgi:2-oxoisovalerate dehydrogenase E1 component
MPGTTSKTKSPRSAKAGRAAPQKPDLDPSTFQRWREAARLLLTSRTIDRLEETELVPAGRVAYQFSARGHELVQILVAQKLDQPHDAAAVYYRSRPFLLASGLTAEEAFAGSLAKSGGPTGGRDIGVVHLLERRGRALVLPASGDVGSQYTPAVGWAQAVTYYQRQLKNETWNGALVVALGGDGSTAANGFWASLNIVTTLSLPYLYIIEDNSYGISVPSLYQTPGGNLANNLAGFSNLFILDGDGTEPLDAASKLDQALQHVRSGQGPALLRLSIPRLNGHSFVDNQAYKSAELRAAEAARDPLPKLQKFLLANKVLSEHEWTQLEQDVEAEAAAARDRALAQPDPDPSSAVKHVFFDGLNPQMIGGLLGAGIQPAVGSNVPQPTEPGTRLNLIDAVKRTLETELIANPRLMIFGEDVGLKGGVHGATTDLQSKYGEDRVFDTSLSEDGIIGRSVGLALAGLTPVPEIQFRKYADPATEQINNAGTLRWRTQSKFAVPIVVRIPVGFGRKTGDPWHSVSGEAFHAHTIGWRVAYPSNAEDAVGLLRSALRGNDPTFFYEHRALYDTAQARRPYPGDDYLLPFGLANVITSGDDLTVITWGAMVQRCLEAAQNLAKGLEANANSATPPSQGYSIEIIDLRTIVPWDKAAVLQSVGKSGKCLIVHEDVHTVGFGAEIAATIAQEAFFDLDAPLVRLTTPDMPVPYNTGLMDAVVPTVEKIRAAMEKLLRL